MAPTHKRRWVALPLQAARGLFRRHKTRRTQNFAGRRQAEVAANAPSEVGDPGLIVLINQDVGRFEIAVKDALLVRIVNGIGDGLAVTRRSAAGQTPFANDLRQVPPLDEVH